MLLDNPEFITQVDKSVMLSQIKTLPDQLEESWLLIHQNDLQDLINIKKLV